ncbi:MAG: transglycosylase domain-containing protein [Defluviitaleaceae bacterium]|nr:transglycosylase domain-containing protein [Defluviitaleaceae bacterium]
MNYSQDNNRKRLRKHKSHGKKVKNKAGFIVLRVVVAAVLISTFALSAAGIGAYLSIIHGAPPIDSLSYDLLEGSFDTIILDAHGNELVRLEGGVNRIFAEWDEIPDHVWQAAVAIEDERFFEHNGVDVQGFARAIYQTFIHSNTQGGSTITQQLIKNQLDVRRNSMETKLQEQYLAIQFEAMLTEQLGSVEAAKQRILHLYLNEIYLGHGQQGIQAASWFYFNKPVSDLTISEAAVIISITQWPYQNSPVRFPEHNRNRQVHVLNAMLRLGYITEAQHREAYNDDPFVRIQQVTEEFRTDAVIWHYFVDAVISQLYRDFRAQGRNSREAWRLVYHGGLRVYTTMDPRVQAIVDDIYLNEANFPTASPDFYYHLTYIATIRNQVTGLSRNREISSDRWDRRATNRDMFDDFKTWAEGQLLGMDDYIVAYRFFFAPQPQSSVVILDHNNGHVLAIAGGRGEKQANRAFCRATEALRQPGSVFKMFASFAPALDMGLITAATTYDDVPHILRQPGHAPRVWPRNWYANSAFPFRGFSSIRRAVADSMNVVAVLNMEATGTRNVFNYLLNFGFTTLGEELADNLSLSLGSGEVTNIELTAAQGAIANGGILQPTILYTRVYDVNNNLIIDNTALEPTQVLTRYSSYLLIDTMRSVVIDGTGTRARFQNLPGMDNMGKTGTTQDGRDQYYTGSTPHLSASVWIGHDIPRPMSSRVTGARFDVTLWRYVMERVHIELGLEAATFQQPPGFERASICRVSGLLPVPGLCNHDPRGSQIGTEIFAPGTIPTTFCHIHREFTMCSVSGMAPGPWCPVDHIVTRVGIERNRDWMEVAGNPAVRDAAHEVPQAYLRGEICDVHDAFYIGQPDDHPYNDDPYDHYNTGGTGFEPTDRPQEPDDPGGAVGYPGPSGPLIDDDEDEDDLLLLP